MLKSRILLVEDDGTTQKLDSAYLTNQGYEVVRANSLHLAEELLRQNKPNLIVLDVYLPDGSGISFCKKTRRQTSVPIIFLTHYNNEKCKISAFMAGGDDYITKPYVLSEFAARIYAHLRRVHWSEHQMLEFPPLKIDKVARRVYIDERDAVLTPKEYQILLTMAENIGSPISAEELYKTLWGMAPADGLRTVHVHLSSIRKKLEFCERRGVRIETVRNKGYLLKITDAERDA